MKYQFIIGIDTGLEGACAVLDARAGKLVSVFDIPTLRVDGKVEYDAELLHDVLSSYPRAKAVIERTHAMPKQGVTSMWKMGYGVGLIEGILVGLGIRRVRVLPRRWQSVLQKRAGVDVKVLAMRMARRLYPGAVLKSPGGRSYTGRSDALMIATYYYRLERRAR